MRFRYKYTVIEKCPNLAIVYFYDYFRILVSALGVVKLLFLRFLVTLVEDQ